MLPLLISLVQTTVLAESPVTVMTAPRPGAECESLLDTARPSTIEDGRPLLRCFEPTESNTTTLDVSEQHVAAGELFFVGLPRALDAESGARGFRFLTDRAEHRRALELLRQFLRWTELDERPEAERPTGHEAPFAELKLSCGEIDGLRPASATALELIKVLRRSAGCSDDLPLSLKLAALRQGSTQAIAGICSTLRDDELSSDVLRSTMLRAAHFDRGTNVCADRSGASTACVKKEQRTPGADACLARLKGLHAVFIAHALASDGLTLTFLYLGSPKVVFTVSTDADGDVVRGPVGSSVGGATVPRVVAAGLAPGTSPARTTLKELSRRDGPVRTFVLGQTTSAAHVALVVVDVDGKVTSSAPR